YGRADAGHASTTTSQEPDTTSVASPSTPSRSASDRSDAREMTRVPAITVSANAGPGIHAASIFVLNPTPTSAPASASHAHQRRLSSERSAAPAAPTSARIMKGSGRFSRSTATDTGVSASATPATVAANTPKCAFTISHSRPTLAAPAPALGSRSDHDE